MMTNIEKNCLQGIKRQKKLLANMICVKKIVCVSKKMFAEVHKFKKKVAEENFSYTPPPPPGK